MFSCLIYLLIYLFNFRFTQPCTPTPRLQSGAKLLRLEGLDGRKAAGICGSSPRTKSLAHRSSVREERGEEEKKKGRRKRRREGGKCQSGTLHCSRTIRAQDRSVSRAISQSALIIRAPPTPLSSPPHRIG